MAHFFFFKKKSHSYLYKLNVNREIKNFSLESFCSVTIPSIYSLGTNFTTYKSSNSKSVDSKALSRDRTSTMAISRSTSMTTASQRRLHLDQRQRHLYKHQRRRRRHLNDDEHQRTKLDIKMIQISKDNEFICTLMSSIHIFGLEKGARTCQQIKAQIIFIEIFFA